MNQNLKVLVVRKDRLGDLLMTLPSLVLIRESFPSAHIDFNCAIEFHDLLTPFCRLWNIKLVEKPQSKYDGALFLQGKAKDGWDLLRLKIPIRVGGYSKWFSFFWLNVGIRQKRSSNGKNEAESNLELAQVLVQRLGGEGRVDKSSYELPVSEQAKRVALVNWTQLGFQQDEKVAVFHPGMRGSALNVSLDSYLDLIEKVEEAGFTVALSVGPEPRDIDLKEKMLIKRPGLKVISGLKLPELAEFFRLCNLVIAPSTGPLHLASWVGTQTVGLFSPVKSQHPNRWAPWGGAKPSQVLLPQVDCPADRDCLGEKCRYFNCMVKTDWKNLLLLR
ncbi:MAG: glycosyltransferase family 9 protein [Deltaproteobacteria bacterium]|nr:glycosyltransferase family 9 protein [Deltaproteobacteria bacterium]